MQCGLRDVGTLTNADELCWKVTSETAVFTGTKLNACDPSGAHCVILHPGTSANVWAPLYAGEPETSTQEFECATALRCGD
jgi:hypothetical protein